MGIEVVWDNEEKTIIRYDYGSAWTWEDYWAASQSAREMLKTVAYEVDIIANFEAGMRPPLSAISHFKQSLDTTPENLGVVVVAGRDDLLKALVSIFNKIYDQFRLTVLIASSLDEARAILAERRARNPPSTTARQ